MYYFIGISILSIILVIYDKYSAIKGYYRIPEKILFLIAFLGGALMMFCTMIIIRHKTLHKRFMIGLPIILLLQYILINTLGF